MERKAGSYTDRRTRVRTHDTRTGLSLSIHTQTYTYIHTDRQTKTGTDMIMAVFITSEAVPWMTPLTACRSAWKCLFLFIMSVCVGGGRPRKREKIESRHTYSFVHARQQESTCPCTQIRKRKSKKRSLPARAPPGSRSGCWAVRCESSLSDGGQWVNLNCKAICFPRFRRESEDRADSNHTPTHTRVYTHTQIHVFVHMHTHNPPPAGAAPGGSAHVRGGGRRPASRR